MTVSVTAPVTGQVEWGDVATWVTAAVALVAVIAASIAARVSMRAARAAGDSAAAAADRAHELERRRYQEEAEAQRRAVADLVCAWLEERDEPAADPGQPSFISVDPDTLEATTEAAGQRPASTCVVFRNASHLPVYHLHLTITSREGGLLAKKDLRVLPPGEHSFSEQEIFGGEMRPMRPEDQQTQLLFIDAATNLWMRNQYGTLAELTPKLDILVDDEREPWLGRYLRRGFELRYGISVGIEQGSVEEIQRLFDEKVVRNDVPDVLVGPHDWIGRLASGAAADGNPEIEPIILSERQLHQFGANAIDAMTFDGCLFGVPYLYDCVVLLRNTDLAPDAPASLAELLDHGDQLCRDGRASMALALQVGPDGDPYHLWPLYSSAGGEMFRRVHDRWDAFPESQFDPEAVLFDSAGSVDGFGLVAQLRDLGVLQADLDRERAVTVFLDGQVPYIVCASRVVTEIAQRRRRQLPVPPLAASPVPGAGAASAGNWPRSFVSVHGLFVCKGAKHKEIAENLVGDFLSRPGTVDRDPEEPSVLARHGSTRYSAAPTLDHQLITVYHQECERGMLMPAYPQMRFVWDEFGKAERSVVLGRSTPAEAAALLAMRVRRYFGGSLSAADPDWPAGFGPRY